MPEIKLKPCPFCGGLGILNNEKDRTISFVKCLECGAESGMVHVSAEYCADERAAERWNRRVSNDNKALEPEYEGDGYDDKGELIYDTAYCPICHHEYEVDYDTHDNCCRNCGQKWIGAELKMRPIDGDRLKERLLTFAEVIDEEPTIGILPEKVKTRDELIRCKDCKYLEEHHYEEARETLYIKYGCKYQNYQVQLDGYCSSAERKVQMIKDKIDKVVESYYNETDECYNSLRYDNNENDFYMKDEIENLLKKAKVDFKIEIESGFSNCAYDSEFIAVAWIEEGKLNMRTMLTEDY